MTYFAGLGLSLSLIVAIGAQNVFVLRQGLRREHVLMVVLVCALTDAALIAVGVSGIGLAVVEQPWLVSAARWAGAAFLLGYGIIAARRAFKPSGEALRADAADAGAGEPAPGAQGSVAAGADGSAPVVAAVRSRTRTSPASTTWRATLVAVLAVTYLNPHVYLDTVLLMGAVASTHGDMRWIFAAGAMTGSLVWFFALGYGARLLSGPLARPGAWRAVDGGIALIMIALAVMLAAGA